MTRTCGDGLLDRAAGFGIVLAVAEAALAEEGTELGKAVFDLLRRQVLEAEFLQARAVDQGAAGACVLGQLVEAGIGGGVLAAVERGRQFARRRGGAGHQCIGQRGFAHAALSDHDRAFAYQQRQERRCVELGREFDDAAAERDEGRQQLARGGKGGCQIGLVEDDGGMQAFMLGGDQGAAEQHVGKRGIGGDHQQ